MPIPLLRPIHQFQLHAALPLYGAATVYNWFAHYFPGQSHVDMYVSSLGIHIQQFWHY
jgi:hypothetical protein